jgi:MOSC domain-containing protein YiiM
MSRVLAVAAAPGHQLSKSPVHEIRLVPGLGVEGDAHLGASTQHQTQVGKDPNRANLRQVHLIHSELFPELAAKGYEISPAMLGENITTEGLDILSLPRGTLLRIGPEAVVQVTGLRNPCRQLDAFRPGLAQAMFGKDDDGELVRKAGVMSIVVAGGAVRAGDAITVELPTAPHERLLPV